MGDRPDQLSGCVMKVEFKSTAKFILFLLLVFGGIFACSYITTDSIRPAACFIIIVVFYFLIILIFDYLGINPEDD